MEITKFAEVIGPDHVGELTGNDKGNALYIDSENDTAYGGLGHDDIHCGIGNNEPQGGDGAD